MELNEKFHSHQKVTLPGTTTQKIVEVLVNPTLGEIKKSIQKDENFRLLRFFGNKNEIYVWPSNYVFHVSMLNHLKFDMSQFTFYGDCIIDSSGKIEKLYSLSDVPGRVVINIDSFYDFIMALEPTGLYMRENTSLPDRLYKMAFRRMDREDLRVIDGGKSFKEIRVKSSNYS